MTSSTVIARLTITRKLGVKTIIEVHADSTFQDFYHFYTQEGRKLSTKKLIRTANRNEGLPYTSAYRMTPGLEILACKWATMQHVEKVQVKIYRKREYRRLINARADALGQARAVSGFQPYHVYERPAVVPVLGD